MADTTSNITIASSLCPEPFLLQKMYPERGGDLNARFCAPMPVPGRPSCCLPCPKQAFFYPDRFQSLIRATTWVNVVGVTCCCFLLLSFFVLPVEVTRRHYLSVCLTFAIVLMQLSFIIPLGSPSSQCFDMITPHDMYSSANCAVSGALVLGGGWCTVMWVFLRTLSLHLQICWQVVPGKKFFLGAQAIGWSIPVVFLAVALSITGVSFRFGESCHINSKSGVKTFWGPMLGVAAASIVTQSITFGYVTQVYLRSLLEERPSTSHVSQNSQGPYPNSVRAATAFQALRRIRKVVSLQWRGIMVVIIILADVIYFATVFLQYDGTTQKTPKNVVHAMDWVMCVVKNDGDKTKCFEQANKLVVNEGTAFSVLFLLSFNGIWALILLGRLSIYSAWIRLIRNLLTRNKKTDEFVSYNARRISEPENSSYEMLESKQRHTSSLNDLTILKPEPTMAPVRTDLSSLREYNPSTFSAQMRERSGSSMSSPSSFVPYQDLEAGTGGGGRSSTPVSPYSIHPGFPPDAGYPQSTESRGSPPPPLSPYRGSPTIRTPNTGMSVSFPEEARIGIAK